MQVWGIRTKFGELLKIMNLKLHAEHMPTSGSYSSGNSWDRIIQ